MQPEKVEVTERVLNHRKRDKDTTEIKSAVVTQSEGWAVVSQP